jgi:sugar (pentulose or hexulose) kinase
MNNLLALDIGTQSARAAVVSEAGDILGIAQIKHEVDSPQPGWAQQRPNDWWQETCAAIRQVLEETDVKPGSIAAVASCGQMHGPVGIDRDGNVTTEWVQLWCDKRCDRQVDALCENHDASRLAKIAGSYPNPAWVGIKVRWHRDIQPEVYDRSERFLVPKDFINYRLTGVAAADPSEASGSFLWDCQSDGYSTELADAVGVDLAKFAPVHPSHAVIGNVTAEASELTGLPSGVPVVAGGGDFPVSMLGFGIVGDGVTADVTGTSMLLATHSERPLLDPAIQNLRHAVDGWIPFTILDCGGLSVKWCKDFVDTAAGRDVPYEELIGMASQAPAGSDGLLFYPYMLGERRSENTTARGGYFGLTLDHSAPHLVRSVMEGVALAMGKDAAQFKKLGHDITQIFSVGGGTRNKLWNQIKADVFQVPLELSDEPEAGLKGAALLAAAGVGLIDDPVATAVERRESSTTVQPDRETGAIYEPVQAEFIRIYEHMLGFWK